MLSELIHPPDRGLKVRKIRSNQVTSTHESDQNSPLKQRPRLDASFDARLEQCPPEAYKNGCGISGVKFVWPCNIPDRRTIYRIEGHRRKSRLVATKHEKPATTRRPQTQWTVHTGQIQARVSFISRFKYRPSAIGQRWCFSFGAMKAGRGEKCSDKMLRTRARPTEPGVFKFSAVTVAWPIVCVKSSSKVE